MSVLDQEIKELPFKRPVGRPKQCKAEPTIRMGRVTRRPTIKNANETFYFVGEPTIKVRAAARKILRVIRDAGPSGITKGELIKRVHREIRRISSAERLIYRHRAEMIEAEALLIIPHGTKPGVLTPPPYANRS